MQFFLDLYRRQKMYVSAAVLFMVGGIAYWHYASRAGGGECSSAERNVTRLVKQEPRNGDEDRRTLETFMTQCLRYYSTSEARCVANARTRGQAHACK